MHQASKNGKLDGLMPRQSKFKHVGHVLRVYMIYINIAIWYVLLGFGTLMTKTALQRMRQI